jgi:hypothetical protein
LSAAPATIGLAEDVMPLGHLLLRSARPAPEHEALVSATNGLTYAVLADRAWAVACSLRAMGVQPGEQVGILITNQPNIVAAVFGVSLTGAVVVPINARYRSSEIDFVVRDADLAVLVTHDGADEHVDVAALLYASLPGLAAATDPLALDLPEHPMLRRFVITRSKRPHAFVDRETFDAIGAGGPPGGGAACRRADGPGRPGDHLVHVGYDGAPARGHARQRHRPRDGDRDGAPWRPGRRRRRRRRGRAGDGRLRADCPAAVDTPMAQKYFTAAEDEDALRAALLGSHLIPRVGKPSDIASLVCFLASDDASWITGAAIPIDGGSLASRGTNG